MYLSPTTPSQCPSPLSLPATPNKEQMYGKIDELRRQHEQDLQQLHRTRSMRKERVNQGLQEKLEARRNKRNETKSKE